ncbi:FxsA family protein [Desulfitibacter alkalitolerans]|uniref:FxsA family protein n=1 Tax=Desulfitibacter alkalitolerans TaxID=264641 RepID=UPI000488C749|nr:FxsA family protein [Desulfitibacter alkalitolerans]
MFSKLLLIFIGIPLLELVLLLQIGQLIGVGYTVLMIVITGFLGVLLAKHQGFLVIRELRNTLAYGQMPGEAILDGIFVLVGGVVLLTPGFITDIFGFLCLLPGSRKVFKTYIKKLLRYYLATGQVRIIIK